MTVSRRFLVCAAIVAVAGAGILAAATWALTVLFGFGTARTIIAWYLLAAGGFWTVAAIWSGRTDRRVRRDVAQAAIVGVLADQDWWHGADIMRSARLRAGRFRTAIARLEANGVVEARWVRGAYPGCRMYRLTQRTAPRSLP